MPLSPKYLLAFAALLALNTAPALAAEEAASAFGVTSIEETDDSAMPAEKPAPAATKAVEKAKQPVDIKTDSKASVSVFDLKGVAIKEDKTAPKTAAKADVKTETKIDPVKAPVPPVVAPAAKPVVAPVVETKHEAVAPVEEIKKPAAPVVTPVAAPAAPMSPPPPAPVTPPPPAPAAVVKPPVDISHTIYGVASADGSFKTFLSLLDAANMAPMLKAKDGAYTIFMPTDAAFEKLGEAKLALLRKPEHAGELNSLITSHMVNAKMDVVKMKGTIGAPNSTQGAILNIDYTGDKPKVNGFNIVKTDVAASNGHIEEIDGVMLPPSVVKLFSAPAAAPKKEE